MKAIYTLLLTAFLTAEAKTQTSVINVLNIAETSTHIDIKFTLNITPSIRFYSCNFQITHGDLTAPSQVSVVSPNANYTTNITTSGGLVLNSVVDDIPNAIVSVPVSWTVRFRKGSSQNVCFAIGGVNECLNTVGDDFPATLPSCNVVIPAELIDFQAKNAQNTNLLTWQTASERNNKGFYVERSNDGKIFENIGFVKGNGTTTHQQNYSFTDNAPLSISYYRLRQEDFDGIKTYSKVVSIRLNKLDKIPIELYPNPTNGSLAIESPYPIKTLKIYNLQGVLLLKTSQSQTDVTTFNAGIYLLEAENTEGSVSRTTFVKQ